MECTLHHISVLSPIAFCVRENILPRENILAIFPSIRGWQHVNHCGFSPALIFLMSCKEKKIILNTWLGKERYDLTSQNDTTHVTTNHKSADHWH